MDSYDQDSSKQESLKRKTELVRVKMNYLYETDPEFRERRKAASRQWMAKRRASERDKLAAEGIVRKVGRPRRPDPPAEQGSPVSPSPV